MSPFNKFKYIFQQFKYIVTLINISYIKSLRNVTNDPRLCHRHRNHCVDVVVHDGVLRVDLHGLLAGHVASHACSSPSRPLCRCRHP